MAGLAGRRDIAYRRDRELARRVFPQSRPTVLSRRARRAAAAGWRSARVDLAANAKPLALRTDRDYRDSNDRGGAAGTSRNTGRDRLARSLLLRRTSGVRTLRLDLERTRGGSTVLHRLGFRAFEHGVIGERAGADLVPMVLRAGARGASCRFPQKAAPASGCTSDDSPPLGRT